MADDHREFDQLAVEHVLGGLDPAVATNFRDHLIGCEDCRRRVVELRGIASDLDLAARQERAVVRTKPDTVRRREEVDDDPVVRSWTPAHVRNGIIIVLSIALTVIAFWNLHLRQVQRTLEASLEARGEVLDVLVSGRTVPLEDVSGGLTGAVVARPTNIAVNAYGLRPLATDERVVLWGRGAPDAAGIPAWVVLAFVGADGTPDGRLVMSGPLDGEVEVRLTVEAFPLGREPTGEVLFTARLDA